MRSIIVCFLLGVLSCNSQHSAEPGFALAESGFSYKIIRSSNGGDSVMPGNIVKVHLQQYLDDSLMNDTRSTIPVYVVIDSTLRKFDFSEIVPLMRVHDSAVCLFPTKEIIKRAGKKAHPPHFLEKGKNIKVLVKVLHIFPADSFARRDYLQEKATMDTLAARKEKAGFARAANIFDSVIRSHKPTVKLSNGVYVHLLEKGTGGKIQQGDSVAVVYKGSVFNGGIFETTTRANPFILAAGLGFAVEGFDSGIASLSFGDRARIYIPAKLGYGANPAGGKIPAFSNLLFEVAIYKP